MNPSNNSPHDALEQVVQKARELAGQPAAGTDLLQAQESADVVKIRMADRRAALLRMEAEFADARKTVEGQMQAKLAAARQALAPIEKELKQLEEGIWTVNLYLGRDEEIVPLRGGEPAPADTPISLRQLVLSMDEETAIDPEHGGIDHGDIAQFDDWLLADPAHVDQVLPEPRGVVVLVPRRRGRDYGDPWANEARNKENRQSYWLIRNGERLYRMRTDFVVGKTIMPKRTEFTDLFYRDRYDPANRSSERVLLEPGSTHWLKAEESQGARQRHYMRSTLILQGLVDRTSVFNPKPADYVSFVNPSSYEAGHVVLVNDAEDDRMLTTGREPFYAWLARLNARLRPGMRIIGAFDTDEFQYLTTNEKKYGGRHLRLTPATVNAPAPNVIHYLDGRRDGGLVLRYERTDEIWDNDTFQARPPKTRASCVIYPSDRFVLPFDLVTVQEMRTYLEARLERHAYEEMFPLLKAAIAAKEAEASAEAPMRQLLAAQLVAVGADPSEATAVVPELVEWWKLANKWHRPLVSDDGPSEARAVKGIVAEYRRRRDAIADPERDTELIARLRDTRTVLIAQRRDGSWVKLTEPDTTALDTRAITANTWCTEHIYPRDSLGKAQTKEWVLPGSRPGQWRIVWAGDNWATWNLGASQAEQLAGPEVEEVAARARQYAIGKYGEDNIYLGTTYQLGKPEDLEAAQIKVWMMPRTIADRTYPIRYLSTTWTRTNRGRIVAHHDEHTYSQAYSGQQLFGQYTSGGQQRGPALLDVDSEATATLEARLETWKVEREAADAEWRALWDLERSVQAEWERREMAREFKRFMDDYRDETFWPAHKARLHLPYPHQLSHSGAYGDSNLMKMLRALHDTGQPIENRTVADLAGAYAELGKTYEVPADIADITVTAPADSEES